MFEHPWVADVSSLISDQSTFRHHSSNGNEAPSTDRVYAPVGIVTVGEFRAFRSFFHGSFFEHRLRELNGSILSPLLF